MKINNIYSYFFAEQDLSFHLNDQFKWNFESYFLWKIRSFLSQMLSAFIYKKADLSSSFQLQNLSNMLAQI